jgi:hypothetical protein
MGRPKLSLAASPTLPHGSGQAADRALSPAEQRQREKAARRHGLYARSRQATRTRHYRAGRLLSRLQDLKQLDEVQIPAARAWCEHEILATDAYAALMHEQAEGAEQNEKLLDMYLRIRSRQLAYAKELGLTPAASAQLASTTTSALRQIRGVEAHRQLLELGQPEEADGG